MIIIKVIIIIIIIIIKIKIIIVIIIIRIRMIIITPADCGLQESQPAIVLSFMAQEMG